MLFRSPEDLAAAETSFAVAVERGEDVRQQYRVRRSDGSYLWVEAAARLVPGADPFELVVRLRDVDDQVRAQRQLSESERLYRLLAENASDVVWQVRDDGTIYFTYPGTGLALTGASRELQFNGLFLVGPAAGAMPTLEWQAPRTAEPDSGELSVCDLTLDVTSV